MPKVIITLTDAPDGEGCAAAIEFNPPLPPYKDDVPLTPAQANGCAILDRLNAMADEPATVTMLSGETVTMSQNQFNPFNN